MRVLILGGGGTIAYAIIKDLIEIDTEEVSQIIIADKRLDRVRRVAEEFKSEKITPREADVEDNAGLVKLMKESDVVINSTVPAGSIPSSVLKAALEAHVNIIDLGAWPEETRQCLKLNDAFVEAELTAVLGLGSSPGITNLMAKSLVDKLDCVETIELSFAYASLGTSTVPLKVPFGGALTEFTAEPEIFRNGQFEQLPPQSGLEDIQYPEPIGLRLSFYVGHEEITTFAENFRDKGIKNISMKAGFTPDFAEKVNFLIALGLLGEDPMNIAGSSMVPLDFLSACLDKQPPEQGEVVDYGCTRVIVTGKKDEEQTQYTAEMFNRPYRGLTNAQHRTGHSPSIGARMLHKGKITRKGVFSPEIGVDPKPFFKELARRELEISVTSKTYL